MAESESNWQQNAVNRDGGTDGIPYRQRHLMSFAKQHGVEKIDFLKMNIEGAERNALLGMKAMITNIRSNLRGLSRL